ncbi:hypothetical protein ACJIZ3_015478 [Penstemon smallii]|uniref:Uncharacterized protein n=1 Tax=Penstemon smallii TaxID=265156 RepID=A0ABD3RMR1_9LAMI
MKMHNNNFRDNNTKIIILHSGQEKQQRLHGNNNEISRDFQCTESRVFNLKPEAFAVNLAESRDFKLKPEVFAVNLAESRDLKLKPGVYLLSIGQSHGCSI